AVARRRAPGRKPRAAPPECDSTVDPGRRASGAADHPRRPDTYRPNPLRRSPLLPRPLRMGEPMTAPARKLTPAPAPGIAYTRVSTEEQATADKPSLAQQRDAISAFAT